MLHSVWLNTKQMLMNTQNLWAHSTVIGIRMCWKQGAQDIAVINNKLLVVGNNY